MTPVQRLLKIYNEGTEQWQNAIDAALTELADNLEFSLEVTMQLARKFYKEMEQK